MRIQQLPEALANQIAAGEVIERPASVVKELLENALDAKANVIQIEIGFGGLNQIKIIDNGVGIVAEDLPLAIAAHATSKIQALEDLYQVTSMGFRGEALASIASISRLNLSSKPAQQAHAMMLQADEKGVSIQPCARTQGTTIEVLDLFYNAPVRKKFLKTARMEFQAIEAVVKRFALSASSIAILLKHNGKLVLSLPAATCEQSNLQRIKKLLGKNFMEEAVYLEVSQSNMQLRGWVTKEAYQRSQRDKQWVYINQRMTKDKLIHHAVQQAYESYMHSGRYPACLLYLTLPASEVDVNVHPTKHEVRFQQPRQIHDFIVSAIMNVLQVPTSVIEWPEYVPSTIKVNELSAFNEAPQQLAVWKVLNVDYVLINLHDNHYLVDIARVYRLYCQQKLTKSLELGSQVSKRPLLVPINCTIEKIDYEWFEQQQASFVAWGIEFDFISETRIAVRTIPQCLPLLNIQLLFKHINKQAPILEQIATCQSLDVSQLSLEEKQELITYLQQHLPTSKLLQAACVCLDLARCQRIIAYHD